MGNLINPGMYTSATEEWETGKAILMRRFWEARKKYARKSKRRSESKNCPNIRTAGRRQK